MFCVKQMAGKRIGIRLAIWVIYYTKTYRKDSDFGSVDSVSKYNSTKIGLRKKINVMYLLTHT